MTVTVLRVELPGPVYDAITERAGGTSIGTVIGDALRATLPALTAMEHAPFAQGSHPQIALASGLEPGLAALRRSAEHTPPPARFSRTVQLAIPNELWRAVETERLRLGLSVDALIAWAWRRRWTH